VRRERRIGSSDHDEDHRVVETAKQFFRAARQSKAIGK
jgi:hypothetical protein